MNLLISQLIQWATDSKAAYDINRLEVHDGS